MDCTNYRINLTNAVYLWFDYLQNNPIVYQEVIYFLSVNTSADVGTYTHIQMCTHKEEKSS